MHIFKEKNEIEKEETNFFEELDEENKNFLFSIGDKTKLKKNQYIFNEGEKVNFIFVVLEGVVRLSKLNYEGNNFVVHLRKKGDLIGENNLFNPSNYNVTAKTLENVILLKIKKSELENLFLKKPTIATIFMKSLTLNTQVMQIKFKDLLLYGKSGALYSTLIRLSNTYGSKEGNDIHINIKLNNSELSEYIGTSREYVNRELNNLKKMKIISTKQSYITIHNIKFFEDYLQCEDCSNKNQICKI